MTIKYFVSSLMLAGFYVSASVAFAEVYKCTGADGKVTFGDQPCATGQKATVVRQQGSSNSSAESGSGATNSKKNPSSYKSRPEYAECLKLRDRLEEFFNKPISKRDPNNKGEFTVAEFMGGEKQLIESRRDMARYKEICGVVDKEEGRELTEKREATEKPKRDAENAERCQMKRKMVGRQRLQIDAAKRPSTDQLTAQQSEQRIKDIDELEKSTAAFAAQVETDCSQK